MRYQVVSARRDRASLERALNEIADSGGRVISVLQEAEEVVPGLHIGQEVIPEHYVIIAEYEE